MELYQSDDCIVYSDNIEIDNSFIFNTNKYYQLHKLNNSCRLVISYKFKKKVIISIFEKDNSLISPIRATFGGFEYIGDISPEIFSIILKTFEKFVLTKYNVNKILMIQPPFFYSKNQAVITNILLSNNYSIVGNELNHFIKTDDGDLFSKMNKTSKKKFKRLDKLGLDFSFSNDLQLSYDLLKKNRSRMGVNISMSFESVLKMINTFPQKTFFFDLKLQNDLLASAFCVAINDEVLYVLYWGHDNKYDNLSPIIFISNSIFEFAKINGYKVLDIGTSSQNGKIDTGLTKFKNSLGFCSDIKFTLSKEV